MPTQALRTAARHPPIASAQTDVLRQDVRDVVTRHRPGDLEDVEKLIELGKLEFGR